MNIVYVVTKPSNDSTFLLGDHIIFNADGSITCKEAQGWIDKEHVKEAVCGMKWEIDQAWIDREIDKLKTALDALMQIKKTSYGG